jgi:hypothetical protein
MDAINLDIRMTFSFDRAEAVTDGSWVCSFLRSRGPPAQRIALLVALPSRPANERQRQPLQGLWPQQRPLAIQAFVTTRGGRRESVLSLGVRRSIIYLELILTGCFRVFTIALGEGWWIWLAQHRGLAGDPLIRESSLR